MASSSRNMVLVSSECDPSGLQDDLVTLRQRVGAATSDDPLALDLTEGRPTALALQLLAAAARTLQRKAAFGGFGVRVTATLSLQSES